MARLYGSSKGISSTVIPYKKNTFEWKGLSSQNLLEIITKLAKKGLTPSQIGNTLRDSFNVIDVKNIIGLSILKILKLKGINPNIPEDLFHLIKKAITIKKHLKNAKKDHATHYKLRLIECHIYRLSRYYKNTRALTKNWKYQNLDELKYIA